MVVSFIVQTCGILFYIFRKNEILIKAVYNFITRLTPRHIIFGGNEMNCNKRVKETYY